MEKQEKPRILTVKDLLMEVQALIKKKRLEALNKMMDKLEKGKAA